MPASSDQALSGLLVWIDHFGEYKRMLRPMAEELDLPLRRAQGSRNKQIVAEFRDDGSVRLYGALFPVPEWRSPPPNNKSIALIENVFADEPAILMMDRFEEKTLDMFLVSADGDFIRAIRKQPGIRGYQPEDALGQCEEQLKFWQGWSDNGLPSCHSAAWSGDPLARIMLATAYLNGFGVEKSLVEAYAWASQAGTEGQRLVAAALRQLDSAEWQAAESRSAELSVNDSNRYQNGVSTFERYHRQ